MKLKRKGLSLVEVIISMGIIAVIGAGFVTYLRSTAKNLKFSGDHFNSLVLAHKVTEDLIDEFRMNPFGHEALNIDSPTSDFIDVTDASSIFFSFIENRSEPYGTIDPSIDRGISKEMQPIFESVKNTRFKITGERPADSGESIDRNLVKCDMTFAWKTQTGKGEISNCALYFSPVTPRKIPPQPVLGQAEFWSLYNKIFSRIIAMQIAMSGESDPEKLIKCLREIADKWHEMAGVCLKNLMFGASTFDKHYHRINYEYFKGCILQARFFYYKLLDDDFIRYKGAKYQFQVMQKLLDIYRVTAIIPTHAEGMDELRIFLKRIKEFSQGRQPALYRAADQELFLLSRPMSWFQKLPNLERIDSTLKTANARIIQDSQ